MSKSQIKIQEATKFVKNELELQDKQSAKEINNLIKRYKQTLIKLGSGFSDHAKV